MLGGAHHLNKPSDMRRGTLQTHRAMRDQRRLIEIGESLTYEQVELNNVDSYTAEDTQIWRKKQGNQTFFSYSFQSKI